MGKVLFVDPEPPKLQINLTSKDLMKLELNRSLSFFNLPSIEYIYSLVKDNDRGRQLYKITENGTEFYALDSYFYPWFDEFPLRGRPMFKLNSNVIDLIMSEDVGDRKTIKWQEYQCKETEKNLFSMSLPCGFVFSL